MRCGRQTTVVCPRCHIPGLSNREKLQGNAVMSLQHATRPGANTASIIRRAARTGLNVETIERLLPGWSRAMIKQAINGQDELS